MSNTNAIANVAKMIRENEIKFVLLRFTDIKGKEHGVSLPVSLVADDLEDLFEEGKMFDGSSVEGWKAINKADMLLMPIPETAVVDPFAQIPTLSLRCSIYDPNTMQSYDRDPRSIAIRAENFLKSTGIADSVMFGPEPEFFLFKLDEKGEPTLEGNDQGSYFDLAPVDLGEECRREIVLELEKIGFDIEASHHEVAPGQHEIDWKYASAVAACDNIQTFKLVVKTIARKHGLHATFMPKPVFGIAGSGMHFNLSLFDKEGNNAFYDPNGEQQLSDTCRYFIAGVMKHAKALTAICNPTVNSYKRLVPGYEAPVYIAWSAQNRSPLIRIPEARGLSTRIELRSVDPAANPYLAMAAILRAGLEGIREKLPVPAPVDRNIYAMSTAERKEVGIDDLPSSLAEAIDCLKSDTVVKDALGGHIYSNFVEAKKFEWAAYRSQVTQWELDQYLKLF